jgi:CRP-like cAMP-binding protein
MTIDADLSSLALFGGADDDGLRALADSFTPAHYRAGDVVMRQDDMGDTFVLVLDGEVEVSRENAGDAHVVARAGRGSVLGELAMLTGRPRRATITALTDVDVAVGDGTLFDLLLHTPGVHDRMMHIAAPRLAANSPPVPVRLRDGTDVVFRPLLPSDRAQLAAVLAGQSAESLRRRFFSAVEVSDRMLDYLVNIDYVDHFAWGVSVPDGSRSIGAARYVRLREDHETADLAFDVSDEYRGRGLATLLLAALAAAAQYAGITTFVADVLYENAPMRAVIDKAGARSEHAEPGVVHMTLAVADALLLADEALRAQFGAAAREVVTAAGLALTEHGPDAA